ncbi:MAG: hypothetical protein AAB529_00575 [Patescibacteria group bacterium]
MSSYSEGQTHQLMEAFEAKGFTPSHVTSLGQNADGILDKLMLVLISAAKVVVDLVFELIANVERDMTNWECLEPVVAEEGEFESFLAEFLEPGESCLGGEEMVKIAKKQGILTGLRHAEAMLRDQDRIPADWRKYYLVFPEVWQSPSGYRAVFDLYWYGCRWYLSYSWLDNDFISRCRLVASRKY